MKTPCFIFLLISLGVSSGVATAESPIALEGRRELFVDYAVIASMDNVELRLQEPRREDTALAFDLPWEGVYSAYPTVLNDNGLYRMYYRGLPRGGEGEIAVTAYAESRDGVTWTKPNLGLYEWAGSTDNNIVFAEKDEFSRNFSPFIDDRPGVPAEERFKAIAGVETKGLAAFVSADGLNWKSWGPEYIFTEGMFDSHNVLFWSAAENAYLCYFRTWTGEGFEGYRTISRTTSPDLLNWSEPVAMGFGDTPMEQIYTNGTQPYFRAPHIYVALAKRFFPEKAAFVSAKAKPMVVSATHGVSSSDAIFMTSRGGSDYDRTFMEAFVRPGPADEDWVARDNTPALGLVPAQNGREMYFYRMSHYGQPTAHLTRYTLRLDGFVAVNAPYAGGELVTKPITFTGDTLVINYQSSAAGFVQVELLDGSGEPLPGFEADACDLIFGDEIERVVRWNGDSDVSRLGGQTVQLRFVMADADLYSFQFQ